MRLLNAHQVHFSMPKTVKRGSIATETAMWREPVPLAYEGCERRESALAGGKEHGSIG